MAEPCVILIAAPDASFRRSLLFAFESAGFETYAYRYASDAFASPHVDQVACAVLDEEAIDDLRGARRQFEQFARPVILLVSLFKSVPKLPFLTPVAKPFLGEPLIAVVRKAISGEA
jgi:FixJ family two-component response regulator